MKKSRTIIGILVAIILLVLYVFLGPKTINGDNKEVTVYGSELVKLEPTEVPLVHEEAYDDTADVYRDITNKTTEIKTSRGVDKIYTTTVDDSYVQGVDKGSVQGKVLLPGKRMLLNPDGSSIVVENSELGDGKTYCYVDISIVDGTVSSFAPYSAIDVNRDLLSKTKVEIRESDTVFDIIKRVCEAKDIPMTYSKSAMTGAYIEMMDNLRHTPELNSLFSREDGTIYNAGGWCYFVGNGIMPDVSCSFVVPTEGCEIHWVYGGWDFTPIAPSETEE